MAEAGDVGDRVTRWFTDEVEERTEGRVTFDITPANSLCPANEIAICVQDGRADMGLSITDYTPQLFPTISVANLPFVAHDQQAFMQSMYEVNQENEGARQVWEDNGLVPIAHFSPGRLLLGSPEPVESVADIPDVSWRQSGQYILEAVDAAGGSAVTLPVPELYEALERGVVEGTGMSLNGVTAYQFDELLPYWTDPGVGHYNSYGMWINFDVYSDLSDEDRAILDEVTEELNGGAATDIARELAGEQCQAVHERTENLTLDQWSDEATDEWAEMVRDEQLDSWVSATEAAGLTGAQEYLDTYLELLEANDTESVDPTLECIASSEPS
ncbi:TRAP transporter substrate-binding protein DctP [Blastococcus brunescens]|uniref:TRAP transporter substrate-binding protein DctP n=1 Tax=Blastococcus brunescens TaxID=1564165 RepID=A0ABZ1B3P7_9ACTN|nr:TRAP transporter substrate-binding protein DctP [Blastococcus sp. BMG 8361]WRL65413.1 TRAP transporter substrate-binding protein DctP [Blastococcus sp. BMG 8361]